MSETKIFSLILLLAASRTQANDGIFWSNNQELDLVPVSRFLQSAHPENPLILFLINGPFKLSDFSQLAGVYSVDSGQSEIPTITNSIKSSKGYSGQLISTDLHEALEEIGKDNVVKYRDDADNHLLGRAGVVLVQADSLKAMENKAAKLFNQLQPKSYRAVLTSLSSTHTRSKRATLNDSSITGTSAAPSTANYTYINGTSCILYTRSITVYVKLDTSTGTTKKNQWVPVTIDIKDAQSKTGKSHCPNNETALTGNASFTMNYTGNFKGSVQSYNTSISSLNLQLSFTLKTSGYWYLTSATVTKLQVSCTPSTVKCPPSVTPSTNITGYLSSMYSVLHFAYACYQTPPIPLNGTGDDVKFKISFGEFEVQPFNAHNGNFTKNVDDCVEFFSIGIWMGIIVGGLMLLIFFFGIAMIANLNTMDRFDDPKGKMIQINAKE